MTEIYAWHFIGEDRMLRYGSNLLVEPGYIYSEPTGALIMCKFGMHASRHPFDTLTYAPGPVLCRVRCWGDVGEWSDKLVCRHRQVVWMRDISRELRLYSCWCIRNTPLADGRKVWDLLTDPRSRAVVEVSERFADGRATREELAAAREAAREAAWGTAWTPAWGAAVSGAEAAAWAATEAAAVSGAEAGAWDAAEAASFSARAAASFSAWAAREAAREAQRAEFDRVCVELLPTPKVRS